MNGKVAKWGREENIHLSLYATSLFWMLRYQPLDISLITMYKSPHSLTAENRLFWKREKKNKERKKRLNLLMSVLDRVQTFQASQ